MTKMLQTHAMSGHPTGWQSLDQTRHASSDRINSDHIKDNRVHGGRFFLNVATQRAAREHGARDSSPFPMRSTSNSASKPKFIEPASPDSVFDTLSSTNKKCLALALDAQSNAAAPSPAEEWRTNQRLTPRSRGKATAVTHKV